MTHTETQAMCERLMDAVKNGFRGQTTADDMREAAALLTRQQETIEARDAEIERLREAAKGSAVIVNVAKEEVERRDRQIQLLSTMIRVNTLRWNPKVSHEEIDQAIAAALQAKPDDGVNETFTLSDEARS